jgi:hypothetical protein
VFPVKFAIYIDNNMIYLAIFNSDWLAGSETSDLEIIVSTYVRAGMRIVFS